MTQYLASVVIPVYNQFNSLLYVLKGFSEQSISSEMYNIIIINDGSTDELSKEDSFSLSQKFNLNIKLIHQSNLGRAASRNSGIIASDSEIIIFCDGDRIPNYDFIKGHVEGQMNNHDILIGFPYDFFGNKKLLDAYSYNWYEIHRYSRLPSYFKKIIKIYDNSTTNSEIAWLSFLVGNSSVKRDILIQAGGFDESFKDWGFEHFELAYRLYKGGHNFFLNKESNSYHIPHSRPTNFYTKLIPQNISKLIQLHEEINADLLKKLFNIW